MENRIHIMGIVNLTPDSFYAGSRAEGFAALSRIDRLFSEGADVVDLGACSTRPGSVQPSLEEEWARLEPVLNVLEGPVGQGIRFSVDTYRSEVVRRAYGLIGPFLVNDISAGQMDPRMLDTVGELGLPYVAMHMRGTPQTMQQFTGYPDVVEEVSGFFRAFEKKARAAGIRDWILDPGFGFSKTLAQNWELLRRLREVTSAFDRPVLVGLSRKSMVYKALGITPEEAMPATEIVQFKALEGGARWLRVHDVEEAVRTVRLYSTMYTSSPRAAK